MQIDIPEFESSVDLVEANVPGQYPRQVPIYLKIDWEDERIWVETRDYHLDGTPFPEHYGIVSVFRLPDDVDATLLVDTIADDLMELIEKVHATFETRWDGHNWRGSVDEGLLYELSLKIDHVMLTFEEGGLWDFRDWYEDMSEIDERLRKMDSVTDPRIKDLAEELIADAKQNDVILDDSLRNIVEYLQNRYDELIED